MSSRISSAIAGPLPDVLICFFASLKPARKRPGTPRQRCILRFFVFDPRSLHNNDVAVNRNISEDLKFPAGLGPMNLEAINLGSWSYAQDFAWVVR